MRKRNLLVIINSICLILVLALMPVLSSCPKTTPGTYEIEIYGGKAGMTTYAAAIALAELINEHSTSLNATAVESPSLTASFQLLQKEPERRPDTLIISMTSFHWLASEGKEPFTEQYDGLRFISTLGYHMQGFITLDPEIKTVADFSGKKVSIGDMSSLSRVEMLKAIFESAGVLDEVTLEYLGLPDGANALRDGLIDATLGSLTLISPPDQYTPASYLSEIMSAKTVYFTSMDSQDIKYMNELVGPLETVHTVPAGCMGETQTEPWVGLGKVFGWAADRQLPDNVVYEICRIIYENADQFADYNPSLAFVSHETMAKWGVPEENMHPGALQFYKDYGMELGSY